MASNWRRVATIVVVVAGSAMAVRSAEAQTGPATLTVVLSDNGALPAAVLERAKGVTTTIYKRVDVQLNWWSADRLDAEMATDKAAARSVSSASVIHVRLVGKSGTDQFPPADRILGMAVTGGRLATVLLPRVEYVASVSGLDLPNLLGHVIAHEIGHLLLPPNSHSASGIMAATMDLYLVDHGGLAFDPQQAVMIRTRTAAIADLRFP